MEILRAARRGGRLIAAHMRGRAVPFHVTVCVTKRCNLRCAYCSSPDQLTAELSTDAWCEIFEELQSIGTERILFFGGEPLLRRDIGVLVGRARALGLRTAMATNGTLVPQREDVIRLLSTLVVSLDGMARSHDRNRGSGSHAEAMAAVLAARAWGVPVKVSAVLNANNAQDLDWLLDLSQTQQVPITLNLMRFEANGLWRDAHDHRLADAQTRALIDRIIAARRTNPWVVLSTTTYRRARQWPDYSRDRLTVQSRAHVSPDGH